MNLYSKHVDTTIGKRKGFTSNHLSKVFHIDNETADENIKDKKKKVSGGHDIAVKIETWTFFSPNLKPKHTTQNIGLALKRPLVVDFFIYIKRGHTNSKNKNSKLSNFLLMNSKV